MRRISDFKNNLRYPYKGKNILLYLIQKVFYTEHLPNDPPVYGRYGDFRYYTFNKQKVINIILILMLSAIIILLL